MDCSLENINFCSSLDNGYKIGIDSITCNVNPKRVEPFALFAKYRFISNIDNCLAKKNPNIFLGFYISFAISYSIPNAICFPSFFRNIHIIIIIT